MAGGEEQKSEPFIDRLRKTVCVHCKQVISFANTYWRDLRGNRDCVANGRLHEPDRNEIMAAFAGQGLFAGRKKPVDVDETTGTADDRIAGDVVAAMRRTLADKEWQLGHMCLEMSSMKEEIAMLRRQLTNVSMVARRSLQGIVAGKDTQVNWKHVLRFCEEAGIVPSVLRDKKDG